MNVKKDIKIQKQVAESQAVHKEFFTTRDKINRGSKGLVDNATEILGAEAEVKELLYKDSLKDHPLPIGIEPMFNTMFLTARRNKLTNESGLYLPTASFGAEGSTDLEQDFSVAQKVMAIGPQCQQIEKGMEVKINIENFKKRVDEDMRDRVKANYTYDMPIVNINNIDYIKVSERDIDYIINSNKQT